MNKSKVSLKQGFTLIELIIVIAILAFVTVVGIHNYGNIREIQAKKMNLANIKRVWHALSTYDVINKEQGTVEYFKGFDSLVDVAASGVWKGTEGTVDFGTWSSSSCDARQVNSGLGIYDGSWKVLSALYNAMGEGSGNVASMQEAQNKNHGMRNTGLYQSLGIYYLTSTEAELLKSAGVTTLFYHNPSSAQAYGVKRGGFCTAVDENYNGTGIACSQDGLEIKGGGPGFRPDLSAFYQAYVTSGIPVAVVIPTSSIYQDLGHDLNLTNSAPTEAYAKSLIEAKAGRGGSKTIQSKLVAFGIGRNAECVTSQIGLGEAPYNPFYDKTNYRSYIALFWIKPGGQGVAASASLAGIVDCAGNTYKQAEYGVNWTTQLDAE